jgi:hypothetical protein
MTQADALILMEPDALAVGAAMALEMIHGCQTGGEVANAIAAEAQHACNAAHRCPLASMPG